MASVITLANGRRAIQFMAPDGDRRPTIRLGKVSQRYAEGFKYRVEQLLAARITGQAPDAEMAHWIAELPQKLADKLTTVGLIGQKQPKVMPTLATFVEAYIARRSDVSPHTRRIWRQTAANLVQFFGGGCPLDSITRGQAKDWRLALVSRGLADASVRKHCGFAKHFFAQAVDHEHLTANPFGKLISAPVGNEARQFFVSREAMQKVLDACPDVEWRLIVALSRYGGLRCPSEHLGLTWDDVDWANSRIHVTSPKTARHVGHESRIVPLFPELKPYLDAAWNAAEPGTKYVIHRHRMAAGNLRTQLMRIVRRAGLTPWPRITHNLRSSRQTELEESFPSHVVCRWIGNSPQVARKHYLQLTEEHFQKALQNPVQQAHESARTAPQAIRSQAAETPDLPVVATSCGIVHKRSTEVHGNRTHLPRAVARGTAVLKTVAATRRAGTSRTASYRPRMTNDK